MEAELVENKIQVLSFILDGACFGSEISNIQEVIEYRDVTKVPKTPDFMLGVINLRGRVIPVIDLRRYFDMTLADISVDTCIIIVDIKVDGELIPVGILADRVEEVVEYDMSDLQPPVKLGNKIDNRYIYGMLRSHDNLVVLLRIDMVFSDEELGGIVAEAGVDLAEENNAE